MYSVGKKKNFEKKIDAKKFFFLGILGISDHDLLFSESGENIAPDPKAVKKKKKFENKFFSHLERRIRPENKRKFEQQF